MSSFDERKNAQETKFVLDAAKEFKVAAKRNKALGHWAAEIMGRDDADKYALEVISADMEEAGDDDVFRKLKKDLDASNAGLDDAAIRDKMAVCLAAARDEVAFQSPFPPEISILIYSILGSRNVARAASKRGSTTLQGAHQSALNMTTYISVFSAG